MPPAAELRFFSTLTLVGQRLATWSEVGIVVALVAAFFALAVWGFRRSS